MFGRPIRVNFLWLLLLSVLIGVAGFYVFVRLMESTVGGPIGVQQLLPSHQKRLKIAILKSDYTAQVHDVLRFQGAGRVWRDSTVLRWNELVQIRENDAYPLTDENIESGQLLTTSGQPAWDVLILPSTRALSDRETDQIRRYLYEGGSVFATWASGIYKPNGSWRGWKFLSETFGVAFKGFVAPGSATHQVRQETVAGAERPGVYVRRSEVGAFSADAVRPQSAILADWVRIGDRNQADLQQDYVLVDTFRAVAVKPTSGIEEKISTSLTWYHWRGNVSASDTVDQGLRRLTLMAETPLTAGIPAGYRMRVATYDRPIQMEPITPNVHTAAFWYDHTLENAEAQSLEATSGLVYGEAGKGRFVYMGHELIAMGGRDKALGLDPLDQEYLARFFNNVLDWLGHKPIAWAATWPNGHPAAATLGVVSDASLEALEPYADLFKAQQIQGTFFLSVQDVTQPSAMLKRLQDMGEIALWGDRASDEKLAAARNNWNLQQRGQRPIWGYYSPQWLSERALKTIKLAGFRDLWDQQAGRAGVPGMWNNQQNALTIIPKTGVFGMEALMKYAGDDVKMTDALLRTAHRVETEKGLYPLLWMSSDWHQGAFPDALRHVIQHLKSRGFWLTTGHEAATWARTLQRVSVDVRQTSSERIVVQVSNEADQPVSGFTFSVLLAHPFNPARDQLTIRPESVSIWDVLSSAWGQKSQLRYGRDYVFSDDSRRVIRFNINSLSARDYRTFQIDIQTKAQEKHF